MSHQAARVLLRTEPEQQASVAARFQKHQAATRSQILPPAALPDIENAHKCRILILQMPRTMPFKEVRDILRPFCTTNCIWDMCWLDSTRLQIIIDDHEVMRLRGSAFQLVRRKISAHWSAFLPGHHSPPLPSSHGPSRAQRHMRWNIRAARDNSPLSQTPAQNTPIKPPSNSRRIISWNINGLVSKRNDLREHIAEVKPLLLMLQETNLDTNAFRFTAQNIVSSSTQPADLASVVSLLANLPDDCDSDTVTNRLLDIINPNTAFSSLSNLPLIDTPVPVQHRRLYRATTKKAICRAKNAYRAWLASRDSILSPRKPTRSSNPIRNEEGVLQFQPISICNTLRSHYMRLAEAGEGHSLDPTHWETMPQPPQHIPPSSTLSMDLPFSLRELDHALGSMHPRKAPGDDGITTALMQAIAHDPKDHGTGDVKPGSPRCTSLAACG
ncbi:hypothetical protein BASA83_003899 [Batrachochytrium salamandrivorans]|nr:hypothetical protein BASA83_003899 [Batrachochytrium salamandrivorans]